MTEKCVPTSKTVLEELLAACEELQSLALEGRLSDRELVAAVIDQSTRAIGRAKASSVETTEPLIDFARELQRTRETLAETIEYARQTMPSDRYRHARLMCRGVVHSSPEEPSAGNHAPACAAHDGKRCNCGIGSSENGTSKQT